MKNYSAFPVMLKYPPLTPIFAVLIFWTAFGCSPKETANAPVKRTQFLMGTLVEITVPGPGAEKTLTAIDEAFDEIQRVENLMSVYLPNSEISLLNKGSGGDLLKVSHYTINVLHEGIKWGEATHGAFDISIGPVVKLWDFDDEHHRVPAPDILAQAVALVNFRDIVIEGNKARLARRGMALDLGGLAKGYAVDRAIGILRKNGISGAIVNAGGDLMAYGNRSGEQPWIIGLQHPRRPDQLAVSFASVGLGIATSGDYQKYFILEGKRYHHILNPEDGMPAGGAASATVTAPTVMQADALATAAFIMGPEKGVAFIDSLEGVEGMWIGEGGEKTFSKGFRSKPQFSLR